MIFGGRTFAGMRTSNVNSWIVFSSAISFGAPLASPSCSFCCSFSLHLVTGSWLKGEHLHDLITKGRFTIGSGNMMKTAADEVNMNLFLHFDLFFSFFIFKFNFFMLCILTLLALHHALLFSSFYSSCVHCSGLQLCGLLIWCCRGQHAHTNIYFNRIKMCDRYRGMCVFFARNWAVVFTNMRLWNLFHFLLRPLHHSVYPREL